MEIENLEKIKELLDPEEIEKLNGIMGEEENQDNVQDFSPSIDNTDEILVLEDTNFDDMEETSTDDAEVQSPVLEKEEIIMGDVAPMQNIKIEKTEHKRMVKTAKIAVFITAILFAGLSLLLCNDLIGKLINIAAISFMVIVLLRGLGTLKKGLSALEDVVEDLENATFKIKEASFNPEINMEEMMGSSSFFENEALKNAYREYTNEINKLHRSGNDYQHCDIADYINEDLLNETARASFNDLIGGMMTGLGILGTFVGLTIGLASFRIGNDNDALMTNINSLIEGIKVAFLTSIFGMIYSLTYNWFYHRQTDVAWNALNEFLETFYDQVSARPGNEGFTKLIHFQEQQKESMEQFAEDISIAFSKQITESFVPYLNGMTQAMQIQAAAIPDAISGAISESIIPTMDSIQERMSQLADQMAKVQDQNMEKIADEFVAHMDEAMGNQMGNLGDNIKQLCEWQEGISEQMKAIVDQMCSSGENLSTVNDQLKKSIGSFEGYVTKLDMAQDSMNKHFDTLLEKYMDMNSQFKKQHETMSEMLSKENNSIDRLDKLNGLMEKQVAAFEDELVKQSELMEEYYNIQKEELQKSTEIISESLLKQSQTYLATLTQEADRMFTDFETKSNQMITEIESKSKELSQIMKEASEHLAAEFNNVQQLQKSLIDGMNVSSESMTRSSNAMVNASADLTRNLDSAMERTYQQIDKQLSEILLHLSGTITEIKDITERVPEVVRLSTESNLETLNKTISSMENYQKEIDKNVRQLMKDVRK